MEAAHPYQHPRNDSCLSALKKLALECVPARDVIILDSNVGLSALVKGRTPLRWTSACYLLSGVLGLSLLQVDFILCTTVGRPVADCPTRDYEPPEPVTSFVGAGWTPEDLLSISLEARFCKVGASCFAVHWRAIDEEAQSGQLEVC